MSFLGGPLGIQGDEFFEDLLVGEIGGPAAPADDGRVVERAGDVTRLRVSARLAKRFRAARARAHDARRAA